MSASFPARRARSGRPTATIVLELRIGARQAKRSTLPLDRSARWRTGRGCRSHADYSTFALAGWRERAALVIVALLLFGCTSKWIPLDSDRYEPSFSRDLSAYAGRSVYLKDVIDADPNTYEQDFTDAERTTWYSSNAYTEKMESYLWYVLEKALSTAGMKVSSPGDPDRSAPHLQFGILSLSESAYRFRVELARYGRVVFMNDYEARLPVPRGAERTSAALERRIDRMIDELVQNVLGDPAFQNAFTREVASASVP